MDFSSSDDECTCSVCGDETRGYWACDVCEGTICNENCVATGDARRAANCTASPAGRRKAACAVLRDPPTAAAWVLQSAQVPADVCQRVLGFVG